MMDCSFPYETFIVSSIKVILDVFNYSYKSDTKWETAAISFSWFFSINLLYFSTITRGEWIKPIWNRWKTNTAGVRKARFRSGSVSGGKTPWEPGMFPICGGVVLVWCPQLENQEKLWLEWEREVDQYLWDHSRSFGVHRSEITMD